MGGGIPEDVLGRFARYLTGTEIDTNTATTILMWSAQDAENKIDENVSASVKEFWESNKDFFSGIEAGKLQSDLVKCRAIVVKGETMPQFDPNMIILAIKEIAEHTGTVSGSITRSVTPESPNEGVGSKKTVAEASQAIRATAKSRLAIIENDTAFNIWLDDETYHASTTDLYPFDEVVTAMNRSILEGISKTGRVVDIPQIEPERAERGGVERKRELVRENLEKFNQLYFLLVQKTVPNIKDINREVAGQLAECVAGLISEMEGESVRQKTSPFIDAIRKGVFRNSLDEEDFVECLPHSQLFEQLNESTRRAVLDAVFRSRLEVISLYEESVEKILNVIARFNNATIDFLSLPKLEAQSAKLDQLLDRFKGMEERNETDQFPQLAQFLRPTHIDMTHPACPTWLVDVNRQVDEALEVLDVKTNPEGTMRDLLHSLVRNYQANIPADHFSYFGVGNENREKVATMYRRLNDILGGAGCSARFPHFEHTSGYPACWLHRLGEGHHAHLVPHGQTVQSFLTHWMDPEAVIHFVAKNLLFQTSVLKDPVISKLSAEKEDATLEVKDPEKMLADIAKCDAQIEQRMFELAEHHLQEAGILKTVIPEEISNYLI